MITLAYEDFFDFPIGNVSEAPYTALGEYHVIDPKYYQGNWREATYWHGWKGLGNWRVVEEDGRHVMEQTIFSRDRVPMMVTGDEHWRDYRYTAEVRPISLHAPVGVAFAYEHSRSYFLLLFERDKLTLARRLHETYEVLTSRPYQPDPDHYQTIAVTIQGKKIAASVNDVLLLENTAPKQLRGKVGFYAAAPCRYANARVEVESPVNLAIRTGIEKEQEELETLREQYPCPKLWKRLSTPDFGTDRNIRFGDLNGDGRLEMVLVQSIERIDTGNFPGICTLTAMDLDGEVLWQIGENYPQHRYTTADTCFQVHDIDGDGCAEVIFCKDFRQILVVFSVLQEKQHPTWGSIAGPAQNPTQRILAQRLGDTVIEPGERGSVVPYAKQSDGGAFAALAGLQVHQKTNRVMPKRVDGQQCRTLMTAALNCLPRRRRECNGSCGKA